MLGQDTTAGTHVLVAAARYMAAHAPTVRAQGQTYLIAQCLHRGDLLAFGVSDATFRVTTICDRDGTEFTKSKCATLLGGTMAQAKIETTTLPT